MGKINTQAGPRPRDSLRSKLLRTMMGVWVSVSLITLGAVGVGQYRASSAAALRTEMLVRSNQREKGTLLVADQTLALRAMAMDNAFSDVRQLVSQTVREDADVIYGAFIDATSTPWIVVTPSTPDVGVAGAEAEPRLREITGESRRDHAAGPRVRSLIAFGVNVEEHSADVFDGADYLGTVRYGLSLARTELVVRQEIDRAKHSLLILLSLLALLGATGVALGVVAIRKVAHRITQPLAELAFASDELRQGHRGRRVAISSGDEIEQLARTFNAMADSNEQAMGALEVKTAEAMESSRLKSEFLANMSHEIRTPMNGILGVARLLYTMPLEGKLRRYVETIDSSASALLTIINDVLDFSKMEAGKYTLHRTVFDLRTVVQEVCELQAPRAHDKGLELICRLDPAIAYLHHGDPDRIRQIINNLLGNAIKFTDRGEVFVDVRQTGRDELGETFRIGVVDTGIGIANSDLPKLFDAFSQVDGSAVRKFGGTGLGLAISKRLVEMMGGSIAVKSALGEGSEFSFEVRLETAGESLDERGQWAEGKRALVVEGHPRWQAVVREHLEAWGMKVVCFNRGDQALDTIKSEGGRPLDVLVVGTQLGGMRADDFVRQLRSYAGGSKVPIIALYQLGVDSFASDVEKELVAQMPKPLRLSELYNAMQQILSGKTASIRSKRISANQPVDCAGRVLVVDDNEINRFVAAEMLEQMGYQVETAADGAEAVERVRGGEFAVVLMDCQMPVMDGYGATREIRKGEAASGRHQPIVALTAHALSGERERVLAAGMDDYLSKPVRPNSLDKMIRRYAGARTVDASLARTREDGARDVKPSLDATISRSHKLIELFLKNVPAQMDAIEAAAREGRASELRGQAHKTKGSCLALGATSMASTAEKLQLLAETGSLGGSAALVAKMRTEYGRVVDDLRREADEA